MKKRIATLLAVTALAAVSTSAKAETNSCFFDFDSNVKGYYLEDASHLYPLTGIVTEVEDMEDNTYLVTATTGNGNRFTWHTVDCDWYVNDLASMLMDSKGTDNVLDDEIILANYAGVIEYLEQYITE